jgi:hypothetical protein
MATSGMAADKPAFSGSWLLDKDRSSGEIPSWAGMTVAQNGRWFRMAQNRKNGNTTQSVEGECRTDGRFHPVQGGDGGSIKCKWDGTALLTDQHWNDDHNQRSIRTTLGPDGDLIQEIHEKSGDASKDAHLVWKKQ